MPLARPAVISDSVSLSDKEGREVRAFIAENCAVNSLFSAVINEIPPNKHGVTASCSKDDFLSGANKQSAFSPVFIMVGGVMPLIELEEGSVPVL
jgi:hypothetical protein